MRIHGTGQVGTDALPLKAAAWKDHKAEETSQRPKIKTDDVQPPPSPDQDRNPPAAETAEAGGVIRLLMDGHFKGVADVRLRINFHDELVSLERQSLQSSVEEGLTSLRESIGGSFDAFRSANSLAEETAAAVNEIQDAFLQGIDSAKNDFMSASGATQESFRAALNSSFETMLSSLGEALAPEATTEEAQNGSPIAAGVLEEVPLPAGPVNGETPAAPEPAPASVPQPALETFIEELRTTFTTALADLTARMNDRLLPELSGPKGNGSAYAKFLAAYNQIWGINPPDADPSGGGSLETLA